MGNTATTADERKKGLLVEEPIMLAKIIAVGFVIFGVAAAVLIIAGDQIPNALTLAQAILCVFPT